MEDKAALNNIKGRLESDVISVIDLMGEEFLSGRKDNIFARGHVPHWGLVRMAMPIAESLGALLYENNSTVQNLLDLFENELSVLDERYGEFKNIIVMLYRHPLVHTDEMRSINVNGYHIGWSFDITSSMKHLKVIKVAGKDSVYLVHFNHRQFTDHLMSLLNRLSERADQDEWKGKLAERYVQWTKLDLDDKKQRDKVNVSNKVYEAIRDKEAVLLEESSKDTSYID